MDDFDFEGDDALIVDRQRLSALTGFPPKDIDRLRREGMPVHGRGRFNVPDCVQWLCGQQGDALEAAKRRQMEAVARKREVEAGKLESRFVEVEEVEAAIADGVAKLQAELLAIPARLPAEFREAVRIEIKGAINRLSKSFEEERQS